MLGLSELNELRETENEDGNEEFPSIKITSILFPIFGSLFTAASIFPISFLHGIIILEELGNSFFASGIDLAII